MILGNALISPWCRFVIYKLANEVVTYSLEEKKNKCLELQKCVRNCK